MELNVIVLPETNLADVKGTRWLLVECLETTTGTSELAIAHSAALPSVA
jgi:hypothetical protein